MNKQLQTLEAVKGSKILSVHTLYNSYAAMLLGYILEVVKNRSVAEQYLIAVFNDVPEEINEFLKPDVNAFCCLRLMARKKMVTFFESADDLVHEEYKSDCGLNGKNKFIQLMNREQQLVFCGVHWQCKSIAKLATELNRSEGDIRRILKDCFIIIRSSK